MPDIVSQVDQGYRRPQRSATTEDAELTCGEESTPHWRPPRMPRVAHHPPEIRYAKYSQLSLQAEALCESLIAGRWYIMFFWLRKDGTARDLGLEEFLCTCVGARVRCMDHGFVPAFISAYPSQPSAVPKAHEISCDNLPGRVSSTDYRK